MLTEADERQPNKYIPVRYKNKKLWALIDTNSDVPLVGSKLAKRCRWKVRHLTEVFPESETTEKLRNEYERLKVSEGLVYRRTSGKPGENEVLQSLVPKQLVREAIRRSHKGTTGGHFGIAKTMDQFWRMESCAGRIQSCQITTRSFRGFGTPGGRNRYLPSPL